MNNIIKITILLCVIVSLLFISCKRDAATKTNDISFDSITVSDTYRITDSDSGQACTIQVNYKFPVQYADEEVLSKIKKGLNLAFFENEDLKNLDPSDAANEYLKAYIENYKKDVQAQYTDDEEMSANYFTYNQSLSNKIIFNAADLLSYQIIITDKKGGTKSADLYRNLVFDLKTGEVLSEQDIFVPEYKKVLNELLLARLMEQQKAKTLDELYEVGFYNLEDFDSNENFLVDNKGIIYIYNQLGFSTKSIGETRIFIPFSKIIDILKDDSPISVLYN